MDSNHPFVQHLQEKLREEREMYPKQAALLDRVLHACQKLAIPNAYQNPPEQYNRLFIQNERLGITEDLSFRAATGLFFSPPELETVVNRLAKVGDLLARKVRIHLDRVGATPYCHSQGERLVERLVARKLNEKEYYGYLSGQLPIGRNAETGEPVYLPTLQKPEPEEEPPKRRWKWPHLQKPKPGNTEKLQKEEPKKRRLWRSRSKE